MAGVAFSWIVDMRRLFVCKNGRSVATDVPQGLRDKVVSGAQLGRCQYLNN
jgi:hypothetical protein